MPVRENRSPFFELVWPVIDLLAGLAGLVKFLIILSRDFGEKKLLFFYISWVCIRISSVVSVTEFCKTRVIKSVQKVLIHEKSTTYQFRHLSCDILLAWADHI